MEESLTTWKNIQETLTHLSVNFTLNPRLVRGLDYYQGLVFEFSSDLLGAQSAFCAGGRYELATALGAKKEAPAVGVAIGMGRLEMMLESTADQLQIPQPLPLNMILHLSADQHVVARKIAQTIRSAGKCVQVMVDTQKMQKMMQKANKAGARIVFILGEDEQKNNVITAKNMQSGDESQIPQVDAAKWAA
jgi:histidyl-tRNA synthetase